MKAVGAASTPQSRATRSPMRGALALGHDDLSALGGVHRDALTGTRHGGVHGSLADGAAALRDLPQVAPPLGTDRFRPPRTVDSYSLAGSIILHLAPGALLTAFILLAAPALTAYDIDPSFALFGGIGLILVPLELGYLAVYARRTAGS